MAEKQSQEPELEIDQIQGNIIPGFNKDYQAFLFLKIDDVQHFRRWLGTLSITTMAEVLDFKRSLEEETKKQPSGPLPIKATWVNIAFSHGALVKLGRITEQEKFTDQAFRQGLRIRSESLGDPIDGEGNPRTWVVGGPDNEADVILIVASDNLNDLSARLTCIRKSISSGRKADQSGVRIIFKQCGATLNGKREHFGFRDGISQPGVRGRISDDPKNFLTPRPNPNNLNQGKPGQDLLWPGEFVFGAQYHKQDPNNATEGLFPLLNEKDMAAPDWAKNGSFLVFRRLRQDVWAFHKFLHDEAPQHRLTAEHFGAMCVGRRVSGASIFSNSGKDSQKSIKDNPEINAFDFQKNGVDPEGKVCPFAAHIRRTNTRDDVDKNKAQTHRLLRRGIPYGEPSTSTFAEPRDDAVDRGLLFIAYQTSIENQFEYIQKLANNPWFRAGNPGYDPIIGQNNRDRTRTFNIMINGQPQTVELPKFGWVIPTGGGYFFAPSIDALKKMSVEAG